jgi:hypothetical protein
LLERVSDSPWVKRPHSSVVEHFLGKEEVTGSIPVVGSTIVVSAKCNY